MKKLGVAFIAVLIFIIPFTLAFMQDDSSPSLDITGVDANELPKVLVNANVLDASDQLISGLTIEDFTIGGDLQDIATIINVENITDDGLAFASVLVIDTSSSMAGAPFENAQEAARRYIGALGPNDPVAIIAFDSTVRTLQDYTTDKAALLATIDNISFGGQTALYDATLAGIEKAAEAPLSRRAVVILSDGGEFGGVSKSLREDSFTAATIRGVPVYTVGLGWSVDRRFLEVISAESNAALYESPTPDELLGIYDRLAFLFRSQYIVTLNAPIAADGTRYDFTLQADTPLGLTTVGTGVLRAPIPTPILSLPESIFDAAIDEATTITATVAADDEIESIEYLVNGASASTTESLTIDPVTMAPGIYDLEINVTDIDGDVGTLTTQFEIATLPPTLSIDFAPEAGIELSEAQTITVTAGGQSAITGVDLLIDGLAVTSDTEAPYTFTLTPFDLQPGEHSLTITATNANEVSTSVEQTFTVAAVPPKLAISGIADNDVLDDTVNVTVLAIGQTPIQSVTVTSGTETLASATDAESVNFDLNAMDFAPGTGSVTVSATDSNDQKIEQTISFTVSALAPEITITGIAEGDILTGDTLVNIETTSQTDVTGLTFAFDVGTATTVSGSSFTISPADLGDGEHTVAITATNSGGQSTTVTIPFTVQLPPTPTHTSLPTDTAIPPTATALPTDTEVPSETPVPTDTDVPPTETSEPTDTLEPSDTPTPDATETAMFEAQIAEQETVDANATSDAQATLEADNATSTVDAVLTIDAQASLDVESTDAADNIKQTADARSTQLVLNSQATADAQSTLEAQSTLDADSTASADTGEPTSVAQVNTEVPTEEASEEATADDATLEPDDEPTAEPTLAPATATDIPTEESLDEPTAQASLTPVTITEVDAQTADEQPPSDNSTAVIAIGVGLLLLILLFLFLRRRGN